MKLLFATANNHKLQEAEKILGKDFQLITPSSLGFSGDIPETASTIEDNSIMKARFLWEKFGIPAYR